MLRSELYCVGFVARRRLGPVTCGRGPSGVRTNSDRLVVSATHFGWFCECDVRAATPAAVAHADQEYVDMDTDSSDPGSIALDSRIARPAGAATRCSVVAFLNVSMTCEICCAVTLIRHE